MRAGRYIVQTLRKQAGIKQDDLLVQSQPSVLRSLLSWNELVLQNSPAQSISTHDPSLYTEHREEVAPPLSSFCPALLINGLPLIALLVRHLSSCIKHLIYQGCVMGSVFKLGLGKT